MWSSSRLVKLVGVLLALAIVPALSACSGFAPVYGTNQFTSERVALAMSPPSNRTEQLIYQDLALRFSRATGPAPKLTVSTAISNVQITNDQNVVNTPRRPDQLTVSAAITLIDEDGKVLFSGTRAQSADYDSGPQILSNNQATNEAASRAAHLLADTIRLTVLGALAK
jgi:LPS-assembly lipoprotein